MSALLDSHRRPGAPARARLIELIALACAEGARRRARAGVLLLALDEPDSAASAEMLAVLRHWQRHCRDRMHWTDLGGGRAGVVVAPIGFGSHADEIGELLVRAIEPHLVSSRLRTAPVVSFGRSRFPDDGIDPETLLRRAERSLDLRPAERSCEADTGPSPPGVPRALEGGLGAAAVADMDHRAA